LAALTITEHSRPNKSYIEKCNSIQRQLFHYVISINADCLIQENPALLAYGLKDYGSSLLNQNRNLIKLLCPGITDEQFEALGKMRFKAFIRVEDWLGYYSTRSATIGTRIHGNILSLQASIPSLPITHDSRTHELCQTMGIPHIPLEEIETLTHGNDIIQRFDIVRQANADELDHHRMQVACKYLNAITEIGLTPSNHLKYLSGKV